MTEIVQKIAMDPETPPTQNGVVPDLPSDVGSQSSRIASDEVNLAGESSGPEGTPSAPDAAPYGPGSLGTGVEGWHPAQEDA